jgi:sugar phosphate isomerase/epimerase
MPEPLQNREEDTHMSDTTKTGTDLNRRAFFKAAGAGLTAAGMMLTPLELANAQDANKAALATEMEKNNLNRIASNTYGVRNLFKTRANGGRGAGAAGGRGGAARPVGDDSTLASDPNAAGPLAVNQAAIAARANLPTPAEQKAKYGEITMLDFPQFTKDTFPGVTHMDLWSNLFGDIADDTMYYPQGAPSRGFDPMSPSGRKWLDKLAAKLAQTGTYVQHVSNDAPSNLASSGSPDQDALRRAGVDIAKRWLEGLAVLNVKSIAMNSPGSLGPSIRPNAVPRGPGDGYPRNIDIVPLLAATIESYKEMADFGAKFGIKVTLENHWGLAADPMNIRIVIDEVNHPYCEASPDFGNWEHEYMLFNGVKALAPYAHSNVHAKYWDRWGDKNDVQRSARIMLASGFRGTFALEYEVGPWDQVEGCKHIFSEVMTALSNPNPVV